MKEVIHVDEKWFYIQPIDVKCYLLPHEKMEERSCKHESHIQKVMFGAAVAPLHWNVHVRQWWDGKIYMHPFTKVEAAQCNSRNRARGTIIRTMINVIRDIYLEWICGLSCNMRSVARWAVTPNLDQQGNAKPHIETDD